jgi:hypothetical protein
MNGSNAKRNQTIGLDVLQLTLDQLGHMPRRRFSDVADFKEFFSKTNTLIIKEYYSGKKISYDQVNDHQ